MANIVERLVQLIDTSSAIETLKTKIEKELKTNINITSVSSKNREKHYNRIKDKAKYTKEYITKSSFNVINFEGKEDGSEQK